MLVGESIRGSGLTATIINLVNAIGIMYFANDESEQLIFDLKIA